MRVEGISRLTISHMRPLKFFAILLIALLLGILWRESIEYFQSVFPNDHKLVAKLVALGFVFPYIYLVLRPLAEFFGAARRRKK